MKILINGKNPSEVLAVYGLLTLDFLMGRRIRKCRFVQDRRASQCEDFEFRSTWFEFEHADFNAFLVQCSELSVVGGHDAVILASANKPLLVLNWFNLGGFIGDKGNFSKADKVAFVQKHLTMFTRIAANAEVEDLFSVCVEDVETNYLANMNLKKNYVDSGGVYEPTNRFYMSDLFLIVALQNFRDLMSNTLATQRLEYNLVTDWMPVSAAFAALTTDRPHRAWIKLESRLDRFGDYGTVLRVAQER